MEQSTQELCYLLQEVLFNKKTNFQITDSDRLYTIAKENGLSGTIYDVVSNHNINSDVFKKFETDFYQYVSKDQQQLEAINKIKTVLTENSVKFAFLKGSRLKKLYPQSYMRSMGDIDIIVEDVELSDLKEIFVKEGFEFEKSSFVHDCYMYNNIEIEVHDSLQKKEILETSHFLNNTELGIKENYLNHELEIVYLIAHLKKHLITSGIGLRSVIDISIYIESLKNDIDFSLLYEYLEITKSVTFFNNLIMFNDKYLGTNLKQVIDLKSDFNFSLFETFTEYIIKSGVHGLGMSFNMFLGSLANNDKEGVGKNKRFFQIIFLPYKDIKYSYPRLLKHKIFLPVAWVLRILRIVFTNFKRMWQKLRLLRVDKQTIENTSKLFKELGI